MVQHSLNFSYSVKKKESIKLDNTDPEDSCDGKNLRKNNEDVADQKKTRPHIFGSRDKNLGFSAVFLKAFVGGKNCNNQLKDVIPRDKRNGP